MSALTVFVLVLWILALLLFLAASIGAALGRVHPGWLAAACATLAFLLVDLPG